MPRPKVLIEGLKDVMRLGQSLPEAECEGDFAVGQVADDFAQAPFPGCGRHIRVLFAHFVQDITHLGGCNGDHLTRIAGAEIRSVRIHSTILQKVSSLEWTRMC